VLDQGRLVGKEGDLVVEEAEESPLPWGRRGGVGGWISLGINTSVADEAVLQLKEQRGAGGGARGGERWGGGEQAKQGEQREKREERAGSSVRHPSEDWEAG
jgi:hypothetical protein